MKAIKDIVDKYYKNKTKKIYFSETLGQLHVLLSKEIKELIGNNDEYYLDSTLRKMVIENNIKDTDTGWEIANTAISILLVNIDDIKYKELKSLFSSIPDYMIALYNVTETGYKKIDSEKLYNHILKETKNIEFNIFQEFVRIVNSKCGNFTFLRMLVLQVADLIKLTFTKHNCFYYSNKFIPIDVPDLFHDYLIYNWRDISLMFSGMRREEKFYAYNVGFTNKILKELSTLNYSDIINAIEPVYNNFNSEQGFMQGRGNNVTNLSDNLKSNYITDEIYDLIKDKKLCTSSEIYSPMMHYIKTNLIFNNMNINIYNRTKIFRTPTELNFKTEDNLNKYKITLYEYDQDDKLCMYINIETDKTNTFHFLYDNDISFLMQQTISTKEIEGLLIVLAYLGFYNVINNIINSYKKLLKDEKLNYPVDHDIIEILEKVSRIKSNEVSAKEYRNKTWNTVEEKIIDTFIRKLPTGYNMSEEAKEYAKSIKINVPDGYTIVEQHMRKIKIKQ